MKRFVFVSIAAIWAISSFSQNSVDSLTAALDKIQDLGYLPGFAVALVSDKGVHYQQGFGYSDIKDKTPYTIHSLQNIGSISKTMLGIALMKLVEEGRLSLDTPINDILPQNIHNPYFPEIPITIRHLATHTATFNDPFDYERTYLFSEKIQVSEKKLPKEYRKLVPVYNANEPMPIDKFIESMMHPFGEWYKKRNFLRKKPGTTYQYSNMGAAVAGYIIELITGDSYENYVRTNILQPLQMNHSGWNHSEVDMSQFISLYLSNNTQIPPYALISYADGGLITSVHDLSIYFSEMIRGYKQGGSELLFPASLKTMMEPAFISEDKNSGIFWAINGKGEFGHSGGDPGIMAFMIFDPQTGYGRIVFTNKSDEGGNGYNQLVYIWKTLEEYMPRIIDSQLLSSPSIAPSR